MSLPTRKIGKDSVTAIGYEAPGISAFYGKTLPDEERFKFLDTLYESGCTNWDTANVNLDSEELIGRWFQRTGKRKDIFLATKFGFTHQADRPMSGDPDYVKQCIENSLKRLSAD